MKRSIEPALVEKIKAQFEEAGIMVSQFQEQTTLIVNARHIHEICEFLHKDEELEFDYLIDLLGVHYPENEVKFEVVYIMYSIEKKHFLIVKAQITDDPPRLDSVCGIWITANWLEREAFDMFGINFVSHPNLKRIFLDDSWGDDHPLRKDYPLEGRQ